MIPLDRRDFIRRVALASGAAAAGSLFPGTSFAAITDAGFDFTGYSVSEARGVETGKVVLEHHAVRYVGA